MTSNSGVGGILSSLREWWVDSRERVEEYSRPFLKKPAFALRWFLIVIVPGILGAISEGVVQDLYIDPLNPDTWILLGKRLLVILSLIAGFLLGIILENRNKGQVMEQDRLYQELIWFHEDLGLGKNRDADIRCTIWARVGRGKMNPEIRLQQAVDYFPPLSTTNRESYRANGKAGRRFRVTRKNGDNILPVGLLGKCAMSVIHDRSFDIFKEELFPPVTTDREIFIQHMIKKWHFPERQARRLTMNRHSYLCLPMLDLDDRDLLGILYLDSCLSDMFTDELIAKAEKYLARLTKLLAPGDNHH